VRETLAGGVHALGGYLMPLAELVRLRQMKCNKARNRWGPGICGWAPTDFALALKSKSTLVLLSRFGGLLNFMVAKGDGRTDDWQPLQ
jgi:hypothetical protein